MSQAPRRSVVDEVTVLVVGDSGGAAPKPLLDALRRQRVQPTRVLVGEARQDLPSDPSHWIWVLAPDSTPRPDTLAELVEVARRSTRVGIVGPKLVRADDPRTVLAVGHRVTRTGRLVLDEAAGLRDQGQFDERDDVIGVPLPGALVRSDVLAEVGGVDPAFDEGAEGLDLSWRSQLRGHRVVLAPRAVLEQGPTGLGITSPLLHRRRVRQVAMARGAWWSLPLRMLSVGASAVLAALVLLLVKRPREAAAELSELVAAFPAGRSMGARWRFRGRRTVRDRDLRGLFEPSRNGWRATVDVVQDAVGARRDPEQVQTRNRPGVETGPVAEETLSTADSARAPGWWSWSLCAAVLLAIAVTAGRWSELWGGLRPSGQGIRGGELGAVSAGSADLWAGWALPWSGAGLGSSGQGPMWMLPMAGMAWLAERLPGGPDQAASAGLATAWMLVTAPAVAAVTAYLAARVATPDRRLRAVAAVAWAGLAPLYGAMDDGRLGPVVVHVLAPLLVSGVLVATDRPAHPRATSATFGTALVAAVAAWFVPGVLVWTTAAALLVLATAPGRARWRALPLLLLPVLLLGPWLARLGEHPLLLAGGAGATTTGQAVPSWQTLLLHAGGPVSPVLWWTLPLWVLAVASTLCVGARGERATRALVLALPALAMALLAPWLRWGTVPAGHPDAGALVTTWPGTYLSLAGAGVLLAAAHGAVVLLHRRSVLSSRGAALVPAVGSVVVLVAGVAAVASLGWRAVGMPEQVLQVVQAPVPAVVAAQMSGPAAPRYLALVPRGGPQSYAVDYTLVGDEPRDWVRDRSREIALGDPVSDAEVAAVRTVVEDAGLAASAQASRPAVLDDLAIGFVSVAAAEGHPLVAQIDDTQGLTRVSVPSGSPLALWRTAREGTPATTAPARVRLTTGTAQDVVVAVSGAHASVAGYSVKSVDDGGAGSEAAKLMVSETSGWAETAVVRADARPLTPEGETPVQYDIPAGTHTLQVELPVPHRTWWIATAALAAVVGFMALPIGSRRTRPMP